MDQIEEDDMEFEVERRELQEAYDHFNNQIRPPSPPCYGFLPSEIPPRLIIKTRIVDKEEVFESIRKAKKSGPKVDDVDDTLILTEPRILKSQDSNLHPTLKANKPCVLTPKSRNEGTSSRPVVYLLESVPGVLKFSKLPLSESVLARFLSNLVSKGSREAAADTRKELKEVWLHHFSVKLIHGRELGTEVEDDEKKKMIKQDRFIDDKILGIWKLWRNLEQDSRRPARSGTENFARKVEEFKCMMKKPFDICKVTAEDIIRNSGIKDWKEEIEYLRNQLSENQLGHLGSVDKKQINRDKRLILEHQRAEKNELIKIDEAKALMERKDDENADIRDTEVGENNNDKDFIGLRDKRTKIDIMGKVSLTSDRANVSYRDRAMIAASTANALGVDIEHTNISKSTACRKAQQVRSKTAASVKEEFECPSKATLHWDGKIVTLKGNKKSNRVCVYLTGSDNQQFRKLLGVPETATGTGQDEAKAVTDQLVHWGIQEEIVGLVFDTTSSNTGVHSGACKLIEEWRGSPLLWLACRHHVAELHMGTVVHVVTGNTNDPGVKLFRRLRKEWSTLQIAHTNLVLFDTSHLDEALQAEAKAVLGWAQGELLAKTWPREDYKELLDNFP